MTNTPRHVLGVKKVIITRVHRRFLAREESLKNTSHVVIRVQKKTALTLQWIEKFYAW